MEHRNPRTFGTSRFWLSILCSSLAVMIAPTRCAHAQQVSSGDWVGKRVVQKHRNLCAPS